MTESIFDDKLIEPNDHMLTNKLGSTKVYFDSLCEFIENGYENFRFEWKFYNKRSGWIIKILNNKRNVLFIIPCEGFFRVAFTFGEKAVNEISSSSLPEVIKKKVSEAKKYVEGRTIQIELRNEHDLQGIKDLITIKLNKS